MLIHFCSLTFVNETDSEMQGQGEKKKKKKRNGLAIIAFAMGFSNNKASYLESDYYTVSFPVSRIFLYRFTISNLQLSSTYSHSSQFFFTFSQSLYCQLYTKCVKMFQEIFFEKAETEDSENPVFLQKLLKRLAIANGVKPRVTS